LVPEPIETFVCVIVINLKKDVKIFTTLWCLLTKTKPVPTLQVVHWYVCNFKL